MRFGVGDFSGQSPPGSRGQADLYAEMIDQAQRMDAAGLDSMWLSEHHFAEDGYIPSVLVLCAALLASTHRLVVGTDRLLAALHDPIRLAEDAAALDLISHGRFVLGLSLIYRHEEFAGFRSVRGEDVERLEELAHVLRAAWTGPVDHPGPCLRPLHARVTPLPYTPGGPRLMIAGDGGPGEGPSRAARLADVLMIDPTESWERTREIVSAFDAVRGDRTGELAIFVYGALSESGDDDAWRRIEGGFRYMRHNYDRWMGRPPTAELPPIHYRLLLGTTHAVAQNARRYREEFGDRVHLVLRLNYPGMAHDEVLNQVDLWGQVAEMVR
ncbi:MAG: LLM class flavin-dependent oxidoreductase [Chloroflexota bacterium]